MRCTNRFLLILFLSAAVFTGKAAVFAQGDAPSSWREFHDRNGQSIEAKILEVESNEVLLERKDGKRFRVASSIFSDADQRYLQNLNQEEKSTTIQQNWPCFRGPTRMGFSEAKGLPLEWDGRKNLLWKTPLPGAGASSPILFGDHIYLTCYTGYQVPGEPGGSLEQLKRHLIALDRESGEILWNQSVSAKLPEEESIRDHGYAANTPAADEDRIYVFFGKSGLYTFDHHGEPLWHADVGSKTSGWGTAASPVLFEDLVIINASVESEQLLAFDRESGKGIWRRSGIRESWNTPLIVTASSARRELVVARKGDVLAFAPESGQPLWSCKTGINWYMVPSAVAADGIVYSLGGRSGTAALAVRAGGNGEVTGPHRLWTSTNGSNVTSPIYHQEHLYWMSEKSGIAYCAVAATGELVYEERLPRAGQVYASPILAEGRLYYVTRGGRTFVVAAKPQFELLAVNELEDGGRFDASWAAEDGRLFLRSDDYLYCLGNQK